MRAIWLMIIPALLSFSCGSSDETRCEQAFAEAAEVGEMEDVLADLYPAARNCLSVDEWVDASEKYPDALDGADPVIFLRNLCTDPDLIGANDLCSQV